MKVLIFFLLFGHMPVIDNYNYYYNKYFSSETGQLKVTEDKFCRFVMKHTRGWTRKLRPRELRELDRICPRKCCKRQLLFKSKRHTHRIVDKLHKYSRLECLPKEGPYDDIVVIGTLEGPGDSICKCDLDCISNMKG